MTRWFNRVCDIFASFGGAIAGAMAIIMAVIVIIGVVARYAFNRPLAFADEYASYLMVGVTVIGANWVLKKDGHISIDFITNMFPKQMRAWLAVITDFLSLFCVAVLLIQVVKLTAQSFDSHTTALTPLRTPIGPVQLMMPIGFGLLLVEFIRTTFISFRAALAAGKADVKKDAAFRLPSD